jgi:hypothetical protein
MAPHGPWKPLGPVLIHVRELEEGLKPPATDPSSHEDTDIMKFIMKHIMKCIWSIYSEVCMCVYNIYVCVKYRWSIWTSFIENGYVLVDKVWQSRDAFFLFFPVWGCFLTVFAAFRNKSLSFGRNVQRFGPLVSLLQRIPYIWQLKRVLCRVLSSACLS